MKKIKRWLKDIFNPEQDMDIDAIGQALNDPIARSIWLANVLDEIRIMNRDVDRKLLTSSDFRLIDLCARRKAYQDILEAVLSARRQVTAGTQDVRLNPKSKVDVNLDRVTA